MRVLVIDDQPRTAELLAKLAPELEILPVRAGAEPLRSHARSWREAEPLLQGRRAPDVVVLDLRFDRPDEELLPDERPLGETAAARRLRRERRDRQGLFILERLRRRRPEVAVLLTTAYEEIPFEQEALQLKADAFTYAAAEEETGSGLALVGQVRRILEERSAPQRTGRFFWGVSPAMRELRRKVTALAPTPMPLLVTGPTGTGKSLLVRDVIHPLSGRSGALVPFDCATVPEGLLQAALFGALRGAFTGAVADRPGVFEAAADGTLFLDEIENLTADAQKMLLTALNDGTIRRLGSSAETAHTARFVAASNTDLPRRVAEGSFRSDLLMRLNPSLALVLPPLSERREDLPELARLTAAAFLAAPRHRHAIASLVRAAGGPEPDGAFALALSELEARDSPSAVVFVLPGKAWSAMQRHPWPGNLRQFEMAVTDSLAAAVYAGAGASLDRSGRARIALDARLLFDLLAGARASEPAAERFAVERPRASSVAGFRRELERTTLRALFREAGGDFERMAELMTGSRKEARAVRLRFNKLGLSARGEK
jgi:DNA-binding NtrC family response regulator